MNVLKPTVVREATDIGDGDGNFPEAAIGRRLAERRVPAGRLGHIDEVATNAGVGRPQGRAKRSRNSVTETMARAFWLRSGDRYEPRKMSG